MVPLVDISVQCCCRRTSWIHCWVLVSCKESLCTWQWEGDKRGFQGQSACVMGVSKTGSWLSSGWVQWINAEEDHLHLRLDVRRNLILCRILYSITTLLDVLQIRGLVQNSEWSTKPSTVESNANWPKWLIAASGVNFVAAVYLLIVRKLSRWQHKLWTMQIGWEKRDHSSWLEEIPPKVRLQGAVRGGGPESSTERWKASLVRAPPSVYKAFPAALKIYQV